MFTDKWVYRRSGHTMPCSIVMRLNVLNLNVAGSRWGDKFNTWVITRESSRLRPWALFVGSSNPWALGYALTTWVTAELDSRTRCHTKTWGLHHAITTWPLIKFYQGKITKKFWIFVLKLYDLAWIIYKNELFNNYLCLYLDNLDINYHWDYCCMSTHCSTAHRLCSQLCRNPNLQLWRGSVTIWDTSSVWYFGCQYCGNNSTNERQNSAHNKYLSYLSPSALSVIIGIYDKGGFFVMNKCFSLISMRRFICLITHSTRIRTFYI